MYYVSGPEPVRIQRETPAQNDDFKRFYYGAYSTEINTSNIKERSQGINGSTNTLRGTDDDVKNKNEGVSIWMQYAKRYAKMKDDMYILDQSRLNFGQQMKADADGKIIDLREIPVDADGYDYNNPARVRAPAIVISGLNQRERTQQYNKLYDKEAVFIPEDIEVVEDNGELYITE
jgi:hypothetical protein